MFAYYNKKMDKYIGKVKLINLPNNKRPRWRWIVRKREDGRYIVKAPKINVLINKLHLLRENDFNKETLLPLNATIFGKTKSKTKSKTKAKSKTKSKSKKIIKIMKITKK